MKLEIDGLDTARVTKIESFTVKQDGHDVDARSALDQLEVPNLAFVFSRRSTSVGRLLRQLRHQGQQRRRQGARRRAEVPRQAIGTRSSRCTFSHLGIFKLTPEKVEAGSETIRARQGRAVLRGLSFTYSSAATWLAPMAADAREVPSAPAPPGSAASALARRWQRATAPGRRRGRGRLRPAASTATRFFFELDGAPHRLAHAAQGGLATADIVTEKLGRDHIAKKHIANVKYKDISVQFGVGMSKGLYDWIKSTFDEKYSRRTGAIIAVDINYKAKAAANFTNALITEVGIPALDAGVQGSRRT